MIMPMAQLYILVLGSVFALTCGESFLAKSPIELSQEEVKQILFSELLGHADKARIRSIESELRPMFVSLPKTQQGRLEPATVRYALRRYFLDQYGWYVKGVDGGSDAMDSSAATTVLKARAPAYIQSLLENQLLGDGMSLHELAIFAATLSNLIHAEAIGQLEGIFVAMGLPTVGPVQTDRADAALNAFVVAYLLGSSAVVHSVWDIEQNKYQLMAQYPNLNETEMWVQDLRHVHQLEQQSHLNPFVKRTVTFDDYASFALQFGHRFGAFQNLECHTLKRKLVEMENAGSGRVLLSRFYSNALAGEWEFMESVEYLRNQGALDETDPDSPSVVIPNYITSRMNCLTASEFYAVCCLNECDELLAHIETQVASPSTDAAHIADIVARLQSDTVDAPRNLSATLLTRLSEISKTHSGQVPLHGRLFAQWMHHAYPRECPFPHISGSVKPMYPQEWLETMGEALLEVSQEVMEEHASRLSHASMRPVVLPWSTDEELLSERSLVGSSIPCLPSLKVVVAMSALASFALPLIYALKAAVSGHHENKLEKYLV